jgi:hypothetical protein
VSDATVKRSVGEESDEFERHKRARLAEKGMRCSCPRVLCWRLSNDKSPLVFLAERKQAAIASQKAPPTTLPSDAAAPAAKAPSKPKPASGAAAIPDEYLPPNKILFIQNIPEDYGVESLTALFARYAGFKEVRTVPGRTNIAFVEYENEQSAIDAKQQTGALVLGEKPIKVTYQRQ